MRRLIHLGLLLLVVALAAIVGSAGHGSASQDRYPNVLLVSVDTLRQDHVGRHRRSTSITPNIDQLAAEAVVFPNAYSQAGWTLPSMATILTGRYPKDHGATQFHTRLDSSLPTLASILRDRGFDTSGYVTHILLTSQFGMSKGFDRLDSSLLALGEPREVITSKRLTDMTLEGIESANEPFFIWAHYFDPHFEYMEHPDWREFGGTPIGRYDQEIAYTDHHVGRLLAHLTKSGLMERTIIVFTSDHGEEFEEHGGSYHYTMYDEVLRVPLILKAPGLKAGVRNVAVQQIDLLPTILDLVGVTAPEGLPGANILKVADDQRAVFVERDRPSGFKQRAIIQGSRKLIQIEEVDRLTLPPEARGNYTPVENVHAGIYLFDREQDPAERRNLYSEEDPRALELLADLATHFESASAGTKGDSIELDEKTKKQLRDLGYLK